MKLTLLKNKKEQFQQEVFDIVFEELKKGVRVLNPSSDIKYIKIEFNEDENGKAYFCDNEGISFISKKDDIKISSDTLNKNELSYVRDIVGVLDFFAKNYPVDLDDYILISPSGIECNFLNQNKQKNKMKI